MRKFLIAGSAALIMSVSGAALAGEDPSLSASTVNATSSASVRKGLEAMGYRVGRIEAEHDCYEALAMNDSGLPIQVTYDAATGELLQARLVPAKDRARRK